MKDSLNLRKLTYDVLHLIVLALSVFLVVSISLETFHTVPFLTSHHYDIIQFWICIYFLADFFIELVMSHNRRRYLATHFVYFFVSIPYNALIAMLGITLTPEVDFIVRFIPLVRGGYALSIVIGWFTSNRALSMVITYLVILMATDYFTSIVFYVAEQNVNPQVVDYADALYWSSMEMVTTGSNISPVTPVGRILGFAISCLGVLMLPLFTVYVTSIIQKHNSILDVPSQPAARSKSDDDTDASAM